MTQDGDLMELGGMAAVLATAHEVGLTSELLGPPRSPEDYASLLDLDEQATALVLDALTALGVATRTGGAYTAAAGLREPAGGSLGPASVAALWAHLPRFLRSGERFASMDGDAGERADSYRDLAGELGKLFEPSANALATQLGGAPRRILDVGAGSGVWSLAMAELSSDTSVTALDLPAVLPNFLERAASLGLADRVDTLPGEYHRVELPTAAFDRIVLANVLHLEPEDGAKSLVARAASALTPAGQLVIIDALEDHVLAHAIYSLHLAMRTHSGRNHSREAIQRWCSDAGLDDPRLVSLEKPLHAQAALVARRSPGDQGAAHRRRDERVPERRARAGVEGTPRRGSAEPSPERGMSAEGG